MPSVVGAININKNQGSSNVGDVLRIAPERISKNFVGQGHGITGNNVSTNNNNNSTKVKPSK